MKTPKTFLTLIAVTFLSFLTSCSDQITSSGDASFKNTEIMQPSLEAGIPLQQPVHRIQLTLKAFRTHKFVAPQIGFINFTSVDINLSNYADADYLKADCRNIFVYGSNGAEFPLSCHSSGFDAKEIVIENLSMKTVTLDVLLKGTRFSAVVTTQNE